MHVRLHDLSEQRSIDPPSPLQDRWEETPSPQLVTFKSTSPALVDSNSTLGAVELIGPGIAALETAGADDPSRLRLDQRLQHEIDTPTHHIDIATGADRVKQLRRVKLAKGHRVVLD
jgi:hypothetical protein